VVSKLPSQQEGEFVFPVFFFCAIKSSENQNRFLRGKQTGKYNLFRNDFQQKTLANHSKEENKNKKTKKTKKTKEIRTHPKKIIELSLKSPCLLGPSLTL
jgi:hypothetical protein